MIKIKSIKPKISMIQNTIAAVVNAAAVVGAEICENNQRTPNFAAAHYNQE